MPKSWYLVLADHDPKKDANATTKIAVAVIDRRCMYVMNQLVLVLAAGRPTSTALALRLHYTDCNCNANPAACARGFCSCSFIVDVAAVQ